MNSGFTTWPERQFEWEKMEGPTNSLNHPMHSGFAAYFFESLGGIKSTLKGAGFKEFTVNPQFSNQITSTKVTVPTPYGIIENSWSKNESLHINLHVPFNTKAQLILTTEAFENLKINGVDFETFQDENKTEIILGSTLVLGSGNYSIIY